jgi:hypothetical protein
MTTKEALLYLLDHPTAILETYRDPLPLDSPSYNMCVRTADGVAYIHVLVGREESERGMMLTKWSVSSLPINVQWFILDEG